MMREPSGANAFFEDLKASLEACIRFARGELALRTTIWPDAPPEFHARDVIHFRRKWNIPQPLLARLLNVSARTLQSWERGKRKPSNATLRLLQILRAKPEVLLEVLGALPRKATTGCF